MRISRKRLVENDLSLLYEQMAVMLASGMGIVEVIKVLSEEEDSSPQGKLVKKMSSEIAGGKQVAEVLKDNLEHIAGVPFEIGARPEDVSKLYAGMSDHCEKKDMLQSFVREGMTYPAMITVMAVVLAMGLMLFVMPVFQEVFLSMDKMLPTPTRILIKMVLLGSLWVHVQLPTEEQDSDPVVLKVPKSPCC